MTSPRYAIEITAEAEADMRAIQDYLRSQGSDDAARSFLDKILRRVAALEQFPLRGSVPKEFHEAGAASFRQIVMPPYRLLYEVIGDRVAVLMVSDGRRDMQALIRDFLLKHRPGDE